tara:strand:+ start:3165 stop:4769 length:1605 start_codon:yes stop_codon:yes gene_type:complete
MAVVQISRIQHRRGLATDLPQLAAGELGWSIDDQKLYIGNGKVSDGAPAVGNTEIITAGSSSFTTALSYVYKGYLGSSTPIVTGASGDFTRTAQAKLDDFVSVKDFGALGDGSTADVTAIQRALDELYCDTDKDDERARRVLYFPAGDYRINASLKIPPFANIKGEGPGKTVIVQSASVPVAVFQDDEKQTYGSIGGSSATTPTNINIEGITFNNGSSYGGVSIDNATNVRFERCEFKGAYTAGGADNTNSKGVTVRSTTAIPCRDIIFDACIFQKFARLADITDDTTSVKFVNCDFKIGYYGVLVGEQLDGSTSGKTIGPKDVKVSNSQFATIGTNGILVKAQSSAADGTIGEVRNFVSFANYFAQDVGTNFDTIDSTVNFSPAIQFDTDECTSIADYFDGTQRRHHEINPIPELQGIGVNTKPIRQATLANDATTATRLLQLPALAGKSIEIKYKMERSGNLRAGTFCISASTSGVAYHDDFVESDGDVGVTLTAELDNLDSTTGNETVVVKYATTTDSSTVTMDYVVTEMV